MGDELHYSKSFSSMSIKVGRADEHISINYSPTCWNAVNYGSTSLPEVAT